MISAPSKFDIVNRGFKRTIALIPGWASDYRIFSGLELDYNYLLPAELSLHDFEKDLRGALDRERIDKVSLFGWSMGGFLASDFSSRNPGRVDELILVSVQKQYSPGLLEEIKLKLKQNKRAFLSRLYSNCFSEKDADALSWFKEHLLTAYLDGLRLEGLLEGLDYLSKAEIEPRSLSGIKKIKIFHGELDKIASPEQARLIKLELPQAEFICLPGAGHTPFLNKEFTKYFLNG